MERGLKVWTIRVDRRHIIKRKKLKKSHAESEESDSYAREVLEKIYQTTREDTRDVPKTKDNIVTNPFTKTRDQSLDGLW